MRSGRPWYSDFSAREEKGGGRVEEGGGRERGGEGGCTERKSTNTNSYLAPLGRHTAVL